MSFRTVVAAPFSRWAINLCNELGINPRSRDLLIVVPTTRLEGVRIHPDAKIHWVGVWNERQARKVHDRLRYSQLVSMHATRGD